MPQSAPSFLIDLAPPVRAGHLLAGGGSQHSIAGVGCSAEAGRERWLKVAGIRLSVLDELSPGEAALLEHYRALPVEDRRALLNMLDRAAEAVAVGARPLAFLYGDSAPRGVPH